MKSNQFKNITLCTRGVSVALGLLLAALGAPPAFGHFEYWNETYRTNAKLQAVTFGTNSFVAVGNDRMVLTSPDGRNWTPRSLPVSVTGANPHLNGVAYGVTHGVGNYVAVGQFGERILHSTNGEQWTPVAWTAATRPDPMKAVAFGGGRFVAVGDSGQIYSSTNATDWTEEHDAGGNLEGIAYGDGRFVAVTSTGRTLTLVDGGTNWSSGNFSAVLSNPTRAVAFGAGQFVLADPSGNSLATTNGTSNHGTGDFVGSAYAATYAQPYFVLAGADTNRSYIAYSTNGTNWIDRPLPGPHSDWAFVLKGIAVGTNGKLVAVGENTPQNTGLILTHDSPKPPEITRLPDNQVVANGTNVTFSVGTWKTMEESYQWFRNGQAIAGATSRTGLVANVQPDDTGRYTVQVSNALGSTNTTAGGLLTAYEMKRHAGLTLSNAIGSSVQVEYRESLEPVADWLVLTNLLLPSSPYLFIEPEALTVHSQRYFRTATLSGSPTRVGIALYNGFQFWGLPGSYCAIEYQANPGGPWNPLTELTLTGSPDVWFDENSGNQPRRTYRFLASP